MAREDAYFRLRLPETEREFIRNQSEKNMRSMTAEIVFTIREKMESLKTETAGSAS